MGLISAKTCQGCKFSEKNTDNSFHCRRFPPQTTPVPVQTPRGPNMQWMAGFPNVLPDWSCGEYVSKILAA